MNEFHYIQAMNVSNTQLTITTEPVDKWKLSHRRSETSQHILTGQLRSEIPKDIETKIGDVIDTFRNTTPAVNQKLFHKNQLETSTC